MPDAEALTAFSGARRIASGAVEDVAAAVAALGAAAGPPLVFDDTTGQPVDLDLRHGPQYAAAEYRARTAPVVEAPAPRQGRGRPRLGVVAREVTLLPRHWTWLAAQPGGASATLRRLVEDARRLAGGADRARQAQEAVYRAMSALAGDAPGFEEAARTLFSEDDAAFDAIVRRWPTDVAAYVGRLAAAARDARAQV